MSLINKYNVPGPRYTSYPTVPYWDKTPPSEATWRRHVRKTYQETRLQGMSLYIHLPYCESLCTYCGCTTRITVNHQVEDPYVEAVLSEWQQYADLMGEPPLMKELHLGGGTPTFFSPFHLRKLVLGILRYARVNREAEMSFEAHPNSTSEEHLRVLYDLGFRRLSLGIQDFDPKVQQIIHRTQSYEQVKQVVDQARQIGYRSVNFDLIYGLPRQSSRTVGCTIDKTIRLRPDRIAFYGYAHVPWMKPAQRALAPFLPTHEEKRALYELGKQRLTAEGYHEIGMDHFALKSDALYQASQNGQLHRNFMGYTTQATKLLIGLGASAISDSWTAFGQNSKTVEAYLQQIAAGHLAIRRGHLLTKEDLMIREHIQNLMCRFHTHWDCASSENKVLYEAIDRLEAMKQDGLVELNKKSIVVSETGKPFVRNVCMALDTRMWRKQPQTQLFSSTI